MNALIWRTFKDPRSRARSVLICGALGALAVFVFVPGIQPRAAATSTATAGSQGTDTALPMTPSAVTVNGRGAFSNLKITVNQSQDLGNQAISVTWTGATPTFSGSAGASGSNTFDGVFAGDYLQMFECWGSPSPSDPLTAVDPGPPPTQCEFGAESPTPTTSYPIRSDGVGFEYSRVLSEKGWSTYSQVSGWTDPQTGFIVEPFDAVDGTVVDQQADYNYDENPNSPQPFWLNSYFDFQDTNEIDFAPTYPTASGGGEGQELFQVDTGLEAPGLGCGQAVEANPDGSDTVPQCWLVIVPRGTPAQENPAGLTGEDSVVTSPLAPAAWSNRIAIPLQFKPVSSTCTLGASEERIVGSELASPAVTSWEPALCSVPGAPPYDYSSLPDDQARQDLVQSSYGGAGMAVFSNPIDPSDTSSTDPVVYAPLTLSGAVIGFNIERVPALQPDGEYQPDELALSGTRVTNIYLTPRLVAKLLTESYQAELPNVTRDKSSAYSWVQHNPVSLVTDPDFLQYNPEFALLSTKQSIDAATLVVEESSSDAAEELWNWVLSDPAARAWLNGQPDPWGMRVNPVYSTNPSINPSGVGFNYTGLDSFPKSDPYTLDTGDVLDTTPPQPARDLDVQDWSPYALTMQAAAQAVADANDGAKTTFNPNASSPDTAWTANGPQETGSYFIMSVTDSASAANYGIQTASLSPSGEDGPNPTFVAPDEEDLLAGEQAMVPSAVPGVLEPDPSSTAPDAYPLTMLTYAATTPGTLDATDREAYANFLKYAAGSGQTPGEAIGDLPSGYAPLPAALRAQTDAAAAETLNPSATTTSSTIASPSPASVPRQESDMAVRSDGSSPVGATSSSGPVVSNSAGPVRSQPIITVRAPVLAASNVSTSRLRTPAFGAGFTRWAVPTVIVIGLVTLALAPLAGRRRNGRRLPEAPAHKPVVFEPW